MSILCYAPACHNFTFNLDVTCWNGQCLLLHRNLPFRITILQLCYEICYSKPALYICINTHIIQKKNSTLHITSQKHVMYECNVFQHTCAHTDTSLCHSIAQILIGPKFTYWNISICNVWYRKYSFIQQSPVDISYIILVISNCSFLCRDIIYLVLVHCHINLSQLFTYEHIVDTNVCTLILSCWTLMSIIY